MLVTPIINLLFRSNPRPSLASKGSAVADGDSRVYRVLHNSLPFSFPKIFVLSCLLWLSVTVSLSAVQQIRAEMIDDPPPAILWDENAPVGFIQPHCEVISEILTHKLLKWTNNTRISFFGGIRAYSATKDFLDLASFNSLWHEKMTSFVTPPYLDIDQLGPHAFRTPIYRHAPLLS